MLIGFQQVLQVDNLKLSEIGPKFEHHEMFPARTNTGKSYSCVTILFSLPQLAWEKRLCCCCCVTILFHPYILVFGLCLNNFRFAEYVQVLSHSHLKMRVWERGAGMTGLP